MIYRIIVTPLDDLWQGCEWIMWPMALSCAARGLWYGTCVHSWGDMGWKGSLSWRLAESGS